MLVRLSSFIHFLPISEGRVLVVHAVSHLRLLIDQEVVKLLNAFRIPQDIRAVMPSLCEDMGYDLPALANSIGSLLERDVLTSKTYEEELTAITDQLGAQYGRDPGALLDRFRRQAQEGANPYWAVVSPHGLRDLKGQPHRVDVILIGDCELQMQADFLRQEALRRGIDLHAAATFPDDIRIVSERKHDLIIIGALRSRGAITLTHPPGTMFYQPYIDEANQLINQLRSHSSAPILIDNLPEPTVQPLGLADRGPNGHRNRFRQANLALEHLAEAWESVYIADTAAHLAMNGSLRLLDDGLVSFTHFGAPGWMSQRPESEKTALHGLFPDIASLASSINDHPYERETIMAQAHIDIIVTILGIERKKCVIVDLDGILWPGVLAETGQPFNWHPEISSTNSYIGLYFGIHEALKTLKQRGIILACVSKNDESTIRELWTYPEHYPRHRLLLLEDFVTYRINWEDKAKNIVSISGELGLALDTFAFIDDHPLERERVRSALPDILIFGDDLFTLRRQLLNDPRLQLPALTAEAGTRNELVKAQLERDRQRADFPSDADFKASLDIKYSIEMLVRGSAVERIAELFQRTTQFNTTGRKFSVLDLNRLLELHSNHIMTMKVSDRFGDHGLVAAAIISSGEIIGFAMSCRVIGLGVEHILLDHILTELSATETQITARIIPAPRNTRVRNFYRDHGFVEQTEGVWVKLLQPLITQSAFG